jgi:Nuclear transport factor 2 (NTF2) domain
MSGPQEVANAFVSHFYQTFDQSAQGLSGLYVSPCNAAVHVRPHDDGMLGYTSCRFLLFSHMRIHGFVIRMNHPC